MGGIIIPGTTIHGGIANPGIPFLDSPSGGIYETAAGGIGISLGGTNFFELNNTSFSFSNKPPVTMAVGSPFPSGITPIAMAVKGSFLYIGNQIANTISAFTSDINGKLTPVVGSPFNNGFSPTQIYNHGKNLFVTNTNDDNVSSYLVDNLTGVLTPAAGSPFATGVNPHGVFADNNFVYVVNETSNTVSVFSYVSATGVLTQVAGSPFATGNGPNSVVKNIYNFLFITNSTSNSVTVFSVNTLSGFLTPVAGSPFAVGVSPTSIIETNNGVCVANTGAASISVFSVDTTGFMSEVIGSPYATGNYPSQLLLDPNNYSFIYCVNSSDNTISVFYVDQTTGALSNSLGSPYLTGNNPTAIQNIGGYTYVANFADNNISAFLTTSIAGISLFSGIFDASGAGNGTLYFNALTTFLNGQELLNKTVADTLYAALAGLITQAFSAKSLTLDHAAGGLVGTPTNDNALAGTVGEYIQASVASGAAVPLTTNVAATVTSIALTAGDWDVEGVIAYHSSGTTNVNDITEGIGTVAATLPVAPGSVNCDYLTIVLPAAPDTAYIAPRTRISLAAPATIYLVCLAHFTISTLAAYGQVNARRVR